MKILNFQTNCNDCIWRHIDSIARRHLLSIFLVGLLSFAGPGLVSLFCGVRIPVIHDEFSYLLAADTFAHGHITNPPHPLWEHFETFYVISQPSYMSKYPPAEAFVMAIGQVLWGHPITGVWLGAGLMGAAICWMLYAWVPARWALVGGLVAAVQFGIFTYWSQSYFGSGAVTAMGGALVFGAIPRIFKFQRTRDVLWLGLGLAVLLNSRPLEGFLFGIPVGLLMLPWKLRKKHIVFPLFFKKIILPLIVCLVMIIAWGGFYNKQITGNALVFPYQAYLKTYTSVPLFPWQPLQPAVHFNHAVMQELENDWARKYYLEKRTWVGFIKDMKRDLNCILIFFFGNPLALISLGMCILVYLNWKRFLSIILIVTSFLFMFAASYCQIRPHYYASLACLVILLLIHGIRILSVIKLGKTRIGLILVSLLIIFQLVENIVSCPHQKTVWSKAQAEHSSNLNLPNSFTREQLIDILKKRGGKYVVIVKYPVWHNYFCEWVYNDAGINSSPVIWARDMGALRNAELQSYFKDRYVFNVKIIWEDKIYDQMRNGNGHLLWPGKIPWLIFKE